MVRHNWLEVVSVLRSDPERKEMACPRCESCITLCAFGKFPERIDIPLLSDTGPGLYPKREITGWQTIEEAMVSAHVHEDCDVVIATRIMES